MFTMLTKFKPQLSLLAAFLLLAVGLAACGDSPTPTSVAALSGSNTTSSAITRGTTVAATTASSGTTTVAATTASSGTTTASNGTAVTTGSTTAANSGGATNASAEPVGACRDADAPPLPTPTAAAPANAAPAQLPDLSYNASSRLLKAKDATTQGVLGNLNGAQFASVVGKFNADKLNFYTNADSYDKIVAAYKKTLEGAGWTQVKVEDDPTSKQALLVYQKNSTKVVMSVETMADLANYPAEFKEFLKVGETLMLVASGQATSGPAPTPFDIPGTPVPQVAAGQHPYATIELDKGGKIVIELCPNLAPKTVENFEKLTTKGFYNGLTFHRVEKTPKPFVVQGGDPKGDGTGGPGYDIPDEFTNQKKHLRGTVAMAHSSLANSAGSQFYICLDAAANLDGSYAIFGQVIEGMDLVDKIAVGDKMKTVTITVK